MKLSQGTVRVLFVIPSVNDDAVVSRLLDLAGPLQARRCVVAVLPLGTAPCDENVAALRFEAVRVDPTCAAMEETDRLHHIGRSASRHDILVTCGTHRDVARALEGLHIPPVVIDWTDLPVAESVETQAALWQSRFDNLMQTVPEAPPPTVFQSFWQGGFECSTHRRRDGVRLDMLADTQHDRWAEDDYQQLQQFGMFTVRDGVRWHLAEPYPGRYDFSSFTPMLNAARRSGTQVIWDLFHYGWPDDLDIWSASFVDRFARFARAVGRHVRDTGDEIPCWCPVNEISFMAWGGGDVGYLNPHGTDRGFELKVQLARASIAAMETLLEIDPRARFVHCEPAIAIHHFPAGVHSPQEVEDLNESQFQAFDLLSGRLWPQIGGRPRLLDICGLNYYFNNQWLHGAGHLDVADLGYRPLSDLLHYTHARYGRPVAITETGVEAHRRAAWLTYVGHETMRARVRNVPVEGICLYPIVNHLGWDEARLCENGLLGRHVLTGGREVDAPTAEALLGLQARYPSVAAQQLYATPFREYAARTGTG